MPVLDYDSIKRGMAIIAVLGMLAPLNSLAEIIDYHQHLYRPQAGERSSPGPKGIDADYLVAQLDAAGNQPSRRSVGRVQLLKSK